MVCKAQAQIPGQCGAGRQSDTDVAFEKPALLFSKFGASGDFSNFSTVFPSPDTTVGPKIIEFQKDIVLTPYKPVLLWKQSWGGFVLFLFF